MDDLFGNASLFDEFDRPAEAKDKILLESLNQDGSNGTIRQNEHNSSSDMNIDGRTILSKSDPEENEIESSNSGRSPQSFTLNTGGDNIQSKNMDLYTERPGLLGKIEEDMVHSIKQDLISCEKRCRLIDPDEFVKDDESPVIQILYLNSQLTRSCREKIESFIKELIERKKDQQESLPDVHLRPNNVQLCRHSDNASTVNEQIRFKKKSTLLGTSQFYKDFCVDCMGWPLVSSSISLTEGWEIPRYDQVFELSLPPDEEEEAAAIRKENRPKIMCFNCEGEHTISECKEPKNFANINKNKLAMRQKKTVTLNSRYHEDDETKFSLIKPGKISERLRKAMGLERDELPPYIYQMRLYGYPPGWLHEAKVIGSGVLVFDQAGNEVDLKGQSVEDGEVDAELVVKDTMDSGKFIKYPGFNADLPKGVKDKFYEFNMPKMQPNQHIKVMENYFDQELKRQNTSEQQLSLKRQKVDDGCTDMEISTGDGSPKPKYLKKDSDTSSSSSVQPSASLKDSPPVQTDCNIGTPTSQNTTINAVGLTTPTMSIIHTPGSASSGSMCATPLARRNFETDNNVPEASVFRMNVEQDIPFENLPGTEGTYERMRDVLKDIRKLNKT